MRHGLVARRDCVSEDAEGGRPDERSTVGSRPAPAQGTFDQGDVMKAGWLTILPRLLLVVTALSTVPGCSTMVADAVDSTTGSISDTINQRDVKSHAVRSIKTITISRIAVMPVVEDAAGGDPLAPGAAEAISAELYSTVAMAGGWDPIPESDVEDAMQKMPPTTLDDLDQNALKLGTTCPPTACCTERSNATRNGSAWITRRRVRPQ